MKAIEITWSVSDKLGGKTEAVLPVFLFHICLNHCEQSLNVNFGVVLSNKSKRGLLSFEIFNFWKHLPSVEIRAELFDRAFFAP